MVKSSCLRAARSVSTINVGDTELKEHSDDEWYPPTPPLYDVTDKLREVNARNKEEEEDSEGKQFTIKWRPDIVEVKFIETESVLTHLQHRNVEETINGLRFNSASNLYLKTESESDDQRVKTQHFIEKICDIDDLCLEDKGSEDCDTFPREDQSTFLHPPVLKRPDVSPVVEEISKLSTNDNDTASEISEIPTDDEKEEEEICSVEKTLERNNCDNEQVPSAAKPKSPTSQQSLAEVEEGNYSSFDDETNSLATTASEGSYCSQTSTIQSSSYDGVSSSPQFTDQVNVVDRSKKQKSPSHSLHASRTNEETKTSSRHDNSGKEVKPDNKGIGEEIKVEFERQHKYIRSRDFVKKSPEDSGFESFQQSSVEQNSNQNSDDDDVIATFSTVMEVDNETSAVQDLDKNFTSYSTDKYTTGGLFADAEEARARSRRLREQSIQQLGVHLKKTANSCPPPPVPAWEKSSDSRRQVRNEGDKAVCLCEDSDTLVKLRVPRQSERESTEGRLSTRSLSSQPLDVRTLVKELKMEEKSYKTKPQDEDSDEEQKPNVLRAVKVWKARKKEEAKLKKRYQVLWNKYNNKSKS